jgi:hypothetical protein
MYPLLTASLSLGLFGFLLADATSDAIQNAAAAVKDAAEASKQSDHLWKNASGPIAGGLVGIAGSIFGIWWKDWRDRQLGPRLTVDIGPGTQVDVPVPSPKTRHIRLRVKNVGKKAAKNCRIYLVNVVRLEKGNWVPMDYDDTIELVWAYGWQDVQPTRDIAPGMRYYVDLSHVSSENNLLQLDLARKSRHRGLIGAQHGPFILTVEASSDDSEPVVGYFQLHWGGTLASLSIQPPPYPVPPAAAKPD